jgi:hypothetical protein
MTKETETGGCTSRDELTTVLQALERVEGDLTQVRMEQEEQTDQLRLTQEVIEHNEQMKRAFAIGAGRRAPEPAPREEGKYNMSHIDRKRDEERSGERGGRPRMTGANAVSRKVDDVSRRPISPRTAERNFVKTTAALMREAQRKPHERPPTRGPPHHLQCRFGERCRRPDCAYSHPAQGQGPGPRRVSWDLPQGARSTQGGKPPRQDSGVNGQRAEVPRSQDQEGSSGRGKGTHRGQDPLPRTAQRREQAGNPGNNGQPGPGRSNRQPPPRAGGDRNENPNTDSRQPRKQQDPTVRDAPAIEIHPSPRQGGNFLTLADQPQRKSYLRIKPLVRKTSTTPKPKECLASTTPESEVWLAVWDPSSPSFISEGLLEGDTEQCEAVQLSLRRGGNGVETSFHPAPAEGLDGAHVVLGAAFASGGSVWPLATASEKGVLPFPGAELLPWASRTCGLDEAERNAQELPLPAERPEGPTDDREQFYPVDGLHLGKEPTTSGEPATCWADMGSNASYATYLPSGYTLQNAGAKQLVGPKQSQSISGAFFKIILEVQARQWEQRVYLLNGAEKGIFQVKKKAAKVFIVGMNLLLEADFEIAEQRVKVNAMILAPRKVVEKPTLATRHPAEESEEPLHVRRLRLGVRDSDGLVSHKLHATATCDTPNSEIRNVQI